MNMIKQLEKYILDKATEFEVYDRREYLRRGEAEIYRIKRKPNKNEEVIIAVARIRNLEIELIYNDDNETMIYIYSLRDDMYMNGCLRIYNNNGEVSFDMW